MNCTNGEQQPTLKGGQAGKIVFQSPFPVINLDMMLFILNNIQNFYLHYLRSPQLFGKQDLRSVSCTGLLL